MENYNSNHWNTHRFIGYVVPFSSLRGKAETWNKISNFTNFTASSNNYYWSSSNGSIYLVLWLQQLFTSDQPNGVWRIIRSFGGIFTRSQSFDTSCQSIRCLYWTTPMKKIVKLTLKKLLVFFVFLFILCHRTNKI